MPVVWGLGATLGYVNPPLNLSVSNPNLRSPFIGGSLSRPHERFPNVFSGSFWKAYPYFLPCVATSGFVMIAFTTALIFFKEVRSIQLVGMAYTANSEPNRLSQKSNLRSTEVLILRTVRLCQMTPLPVAHDSMHHYPFVMSLPTPLFFRFPIMWRLPSSISPSLPFSHFSWLCHYLLAGWALPRLLLATSSVHMVRPALFFKRFTFQR